MGTNEGNAICIFAAAAGGELGANLVFALPRNNFLNPKKRNDPS